MSGSICLLVQHICICAASVLSSLTGGMQARDFLLLPRKPPVCRSSRLAWWVRAEPHAVNMQHRAAALSGRKAWRRLLTGCGLLEPATHS